jgi:hypothetical protein
MLTVKVPQEHLSRLEVYTFGNAANHFNNPSRSLGAQIRESFLARTSPSNASMAIGHIEHYANIGDYVSQIGVLNFGLNPEIHNRFMGRLFRSPYSGHLLNEHYLHEMFPLDEKNTKCLDTNPFMEMTIDIVERGDTSKRYGTAESVQSGHAEISAGTSAKVEVAFIGEADTPFGPVEVETTTITSPNGSGQKTYRVKNLSRLWLYRNGGSPPDDAMRKSGTF